MSKPRCDRIQCDDCGRWLRPHQWLQHWHQVIEETPLRMTVIREATTT